MQTNKAVTWHSFRGLKPDDYRSLRGWLSENFGRDVDARRPFCATSTRRREHAEDQCGGRPSKTLRRVRHERATIYNALLSGLR